MPGLQYKSVNFGRYHGTKGVSVRNGAFAGYSFVDVPDMRYKFVNLEGYRGAEGVGVGTPAVPSPAIFKLTCQVYSTNLSTLKVTAAPKAWAFVTIPSPAFLKATRRICGTNLTTSEVTEAPKACALGTIPSPAFCKVDVPCVLYKSVNFRGHRSAEGVGVGHNAHSAFAGYCQADMVRLW